MRRLVRWVIGIASAVAVWRLWSRRHVEGEVTPELDPAEALREKLAETRQEVEVEPETEAPSTAEVEPGGIDERRARIHAKAQETIDTMREGEA